MDFKITRRMIEVVREEKASRVKALPDHPEAANDQWQFHEQPLLNELCLAILVAVRHNFEREVVRMAARAGKKSGGLSFEKYQERIEKLREKVRGGRGLQKLDGCLPLSQHAEWDTSMETLRLLANSWKHNPWAKPDKKLLKRLRADLRDSDDDPGLDLITGVSYAPLPESHRLRRGLARYLGLANNADYCKIAEAFVGKAQQFLRDVENNANLQSLRPHTASLKPSQFEQ